MHTIDRIRSINNMLKAKEELDYLATMLDFAEESHKQLEDILRKAGRL